MREPLKDLLDDAEKAHAEPNLAFAAIQSKRGGSRGSRAVAFASAGSLALVLVGLAAGRLVMPPAVSTAATTISGKQLASDAPDTGALLSMCKAFTDEDGNQLDWARGVDACQKVLTADPINIDARKLKKLAEREMTEKKIFDEGHRLFEQGQEREAMEAYLRIDSDSFYYRQARSEFKKAAPGAMKRAGEACLADYQAKNVEKAWPECERMNEVAYFVGYETAEQKAQQHAFEELSRQHRGPDAWAIREDYRRFVGGEVTTSYPKDRASAISRLYPDPDLAKAVADYALDAAQGMEAVQRYIGRGGKDSAAAKEVYRHMENALGSHQAGSEKMVALDLKRAAIDFRVQLEQDAKVMPQTPQAFESDLSRQTRKDISEAFAKRGKELFAEGRLPDSFEMCEGGGDFQLGNPTVLECYSALEDKAAPLADQDCASAKKAIKITRKDSPTHTKADTFLRENCSR